MPQPLHLDVLSISSASDLESEVLTPSEESSTVFTTPFDNIRLPILGVHEMTPPEDMPLGQPAPHPEYYLQGEMMILQLGQVLYRVPSHYLLASSYFRDLFSAQHGNHPIVLDGQYVSNQDFERFLKVVIPRGLEEDRLTSSKEWDSVRRVSDTWGFTSIKRLACHKLLPLSSPVERFALARTEDLPDWLLDAFVELILREESLGLSDAVVLDVSDIIKIGQAREAFRIAGIRQHSVARTIAAQILDIDISDEKAPTPPEVPRETCHTAHLANIRNAISNEELSLDVDRHVRHINVHAKSLIEGQVLKMKYYPSLERAESTKPPQTSIARPSENNSTTYLSSSGDHPGTIPICSGVFDTQEVRPWTELAAETKKELTFSYTYPPDKIPEVAYGLSALDISAGERNPCINSAIEEISSTSFTAKLWSWGTTRCYSASLNWLAIPSDAGFQTGTKSNYLPWGGGRLHDGSNIPTELARIRFARPYSRPPTVICWLTGFDTDRSKNCRVHTIAQNIDGGGFSLCAGTWADTPLYGAGACWLAIPADTPGAFIAEYSATMNERRGHVAFPRAFKEVPKVVVGLRKVDFKQGKNVRVKVCVEDITRHGVVWAAHTWDDTHMYEVRFAVVAIDPGSLGVASGDFDGLL